jgi:hypothetical protein
LHVSSRRVARLTTTFVALAIAAGLPGCASARIKRENALALAAADTRVLEGCYTCLQDARTTYARLASVKFPVPKGTTPLNVRVFQTDILLALREKEMGLDSRASLERARSLAPKLPPAVDPKRLLTMVEAVLPDGRAVPQKVTEARVRDLKAYRATLNDELAWVEQAPLTPEVRKYIALAVDCSHVDRYAKPTDTTNAVFARRQLPINAPPLLAYRAADCANTDTLALKRVLNAAPAFDEAAYALGNVVVFNAGSTGGDDAQRYLGQAYKRFPHAPGVTFMLGWLNLQVGDCGEAVRYYDTTLALVPEHERALLQKTICLSRSHQDSAAIATATRFIALATPDVGQGYYWRAVSWLRLRELDRARSDADIAKRETHNSDGEVLTLAGIIEHEQNDLTIAETDLRGARATWKGYENCTAAFYLGSVYTKREVWGDAAVSYDTARVCYDDKANKTSGMIEQVRNSTKASPAFKAKRIAALESDLADLRRRSFSSTFNTASMNARLGNFVRAEELLVIAAQSQDLTDQVAKLREQLAQIAKPVTQMNGRQRPVPRSRE